MHFSGEKKFSTFKFSFKSKSLKYLFWTNIVPLLVYEKTLLYSDKYIFSFKIYLGSILLHLVTLLTTDSSTVYSVETRLRQTD